MKLIQRMLTVVAACALICGTAGCGASSSRQAPNQLTIAWWGSQGRNEKQRQVNELFIEQHPGMRIDGQFSQYGDYWQKLATAAAGRQMPDIVAMDLPYMNQYIGNGLIIDLMPYIDDGTLDVGQVSEAVLATGMADGVVYAISSGVNAPAVIYDKTLLDSLGITIDSDWTLDDFVRISKQVYARTGTKRTQDITATPMCSNTCCARSMNGCTPTTASM